MQDHELFTIQSTNFHWSYYWRYYKYNLSYSCILSIDLIYPTFWFLEFEYSVGEICFLTWFYITIFIIQVSNQVLSGFLYPGLQHLDEEYLKVAIQFEVVDQVWLILSLSLFQYFHYLYHLYYSVTFLGLLGLK